MPKRRSIEDSIVTSDRIGGFYRGVTDYGVIYECFGDGPVVQKIARDLPDGTTVWDCLDNLDRKWVEDQHREVVSGTRPDDVIGECLPRRVFSEPPK